MYFTVTDILSSIQVFLTKLDHPSEEVALNSFGHTHLMWESKTQTWEISSVLAPTPARFDLFEGGDSSGEVVPVEDNAALELSGQLYAYEGSLDASIDGLLGYELMQEGVDPVDLWSFDGFPWESTVKRF